MRVDYWLCRCVSNCGKPTVTFFEKLNTIGIEKLRNLKAVVFRQRDLIGGPHRRWLDSTSIQLAQFPNRLTGGLCATCSALRQLGVPRALASGKGARGQRVVCGDHRCFQLRKSCHSISDCFADKQLEAQHEIKLTVLLR